MSNQLSYQSPYPEVNALLNVLLPAVQAILGAGGNANVVAINTLGVERTEVVALPAGTTAVQTSAAGAPLVNT